METVPIFSAANRSENSKTGWHEPKDSPSSAFRKVTQKSNPHVGIGAFSVRVSPLQIRSQIFIPKEQSKAVQGLNEANISKTNKIFPLAFLRKGCKTLSGGLLSAYVR